MTEALIRRNAEGVILDYGDVGRALAFTPTDPDKHRQRVALVRAEAGLNVLQTVAECLELDDVHRIWRSIKSIRYLIDITRESLYP